MAEDIQTTEISNTQISNQGMLSNISNSLEKFKKKKEYIYMGVLI